MKKTIEFGQVHYDGKMCAVSVSLKLEDTPQGAAFSASALVGNEIAGQCLDELLEFKLGDKFTLIYRLWKRWHLNDMKAGCEHQRALPEFEPKRLASGKWNCHEYEKDGGILCKPCPACGYKYGSKWLFEPIDEADLKEIKELFA